MNYFKVIKERALVGFSIWKYKVSVSAHKGTLLWATTHHQDAKPHPNQNKEGRDVTREVLGTSGCFGFSCWVIWLDLHRALNNSQFICAWSYVFTKINKPWPREKARPKENYMNIPNRVLLESLILALISWLVWKCQAFTGDTNVCQIKVYLPKL